MKLYEIAKIGEIMDVRVGDLIARAKIERLLEPDGFVIGHPTHRLVPLLIREDEPCSFWFLRKNGVFSFTAVLENEYIVDELKFCAFRLITPVLREQRRDAFRLHISLNATVLRMDSDSQDMMEIPARTIDLSQTGVQFCVCHPMNRGERFLMHMDSNENDAFSINATVLRVEPADRKRGEYRVAARFQWDAQHDQSMLYRYILQKQIMRRRAMKDTGLDE